MNTLRNAFLIGLATFVISPAGAEDSGVTTNELPRLQGEWSMVSGTTDGQTMQDDIRKLMKRVCKGNEATTTLGALVILKAKITIDPSKKPKTIDYQMTEGFTAGNSQLGIYEVEGDSFKSCFSAPGDPRPGDFTSKPGDRRTLTVWKREAAATQPEKK